MKPQSYARLGRSELIQHLERLRALLDAAQLHAWAPSQSFADIEAWEKDVQEALRKLEAS